MPSSKQSKTKTRSPRNFGTRLPELIETRIAASDLPISSNFSAFTRAVVDSFIAGGFKIIPTRELTVKLDTKVSKERQTRSLFVLPRLRRHWARYCRAQAGDTRLAKPYSIGALIANAYARYFQLI